MKAIKLFDDAKSYEDVKEHYQLYRAYKRSKEAENELPDFNEVIWDEDVAKILTSCKRFGIDRFTISSGFSGLAEQMYKFLERGCKLEGMVKVNEPYSWNGERGTLAAFVIAL